MYLNPWLDRVRIGALGTAVAIAGVACVQPDDPGVAISKREASLVFGVKTAEPATPAGFLPPPSLDFLDDPIDIGPLEVEPMVDLTPPSSGPTEVCPKAPPEAVASRIPTVTVDNNPDVGLYRWKREGFAKVAGSDIQIPLGGYETRQVVRTSRQSPSQLTLTTRQTNFANPEQIQEKLFTIKNDVQQVNPTNGAPVGVVNAPRTGPPDRGVVMTSVVDFDRKGSRQGAFEPTPTGLLLLPLPVQGGESFQSVAVDPKTGQTMVYDATVLASRRIDACGEVAEGFLVEGTLTNTIADPESPQPHSAVRYSVMIAPQYGGMIIQERFEQTGAAAGLPVAPNVPVQQPTPPALPAQPPPPPAAPAVPAVPGVNAVPVEYDFTFTLGQLTPTPTK